MSTDKKNNRLKNILVDLKSTDEKKVLTALKQLRKHGKAEAIRPITEVLRDTGNEMVKEAIVSLLFDLKDQTVVDELILIIEDDEFINERALLMSVFWQSKLDGSEYISAFVREAIRGDYMTCIEALTVVENFDTTFQEADIEDLKYDLDDAIEQETTEKVNLLISLRAVLDEVNLEF